MKNIVNIRSNEKLIPQTTGGTCQILGVIEASLSTYYHVIFGIDNKLGFGPKFIHIEDICFIHQT